MLGFNRLYSFAVAAALVLPGSAACQQGAPASSSLGLALGVSDFHQRDDVLSPVAFRGAIATADASFERRAGRMLIAFDGSYGVGHTNSDVMPRDVRQHVGRFSVTVVRALGAQPGGNGLTLFAGGGFSSVGSVTDVFARDATTHYQYWDWSYYWAHSLDLAARAELADSRRTVGLHATASVLRLVSRPNNGKDYNAENARVSEAWARSVVRGSPEYVWNRPVVFAEAEFKQRLGSRLQLRVAYDFSFASSARPQPIGVYMNRFLLGLVRAM